MAFARFARDSIDRFHSTRFVNFTQPVSSDPCCSVENPIERDSMTDRSGANSLASRVNAIDPYEILRYPSKPWKTSGVNVPCNP